MTQGEIKARIRELEWAKKTALYLGEHDPAFMRTERKQALRFYNKELKTLRAQLEKE